MAYSNNNDSDSDDKLEDVERWYRNAADNERNWRSLARKSHDYYHGDQIPDDLKKMMIARSQPPLKFNLIKSIVNLLTGQEIQGRTDIRFVGMEESDTLPSKLLTDIYRQKNEEQYYEYEVTNAFQDAVIGGRGVMYTDWDEEEKTIVREYVDWQEIFIDACSKRRDYSDAQHVFRVKWVDKDVAIEQFPDYEDEINRVASSKEFGSEDEVGEKPANRQKDEYFEDDFLDNPQKWSDPERERVKLVEGWYYELNDKKKRVLKHCIFASGTWIMEPEDFGRKHEEFPFIFTFFNRDRHGIPYGLVKDLIDPQDVINRSFSKSMHILGTRQIFAEKGALANIANVQQQINKPDAIINDFEDGALSNGRIRIEENRQDAQMAFQMFDVGVTAMNRVSGVNPELQGLHTNARSGTAISMRIRQGNTVLTSIYDCLEKMKKRSAEIFVYLMSQYMTDEEIMRYKLPNGQITELKLNGVVDEIIGNEVKSIRQNDVKDIHKYDIIITESAKSANATESEFTQLVELVKAVPAAATPDFIAELIKSTHLPNKEDLAQSVLKMAGGAGGNADAQATAQ